MENKELHREKIGQTIKEVIFTDKEIILKNENGGIKIGQNHDQDCCESVYADFEQMKYYVKEISGKMVQEMIIKSVSKMGFIIELWFDYDNGEKIFIPCYNFQNGYYSSNLELIIETDKKITIDISDCVEDHID
jgi:hypothetical protein